MWVRLAFRWPLTEGKMGKLGGTRNMLRWRIMNISIRNASRGWVRVLTMIRLSPCLELASILGFVAWKGGLDWKDANVSNSLVNGALYGQNHTHRKIRNCTKIYDYKNPALKPPNKSKKTSPEPTRIAPPSPRTPNSARC